MSVYKRDYKNEHDGDENGEKRWAYAFSYNKVRYRKAGFLTRREAELAEQKARSEVIVNGHRLIPSGRCTFEEIRDSYLESRTAVVVEKTIDSERREFVRFIRFFGRKRLDEIIEGDVIAYRTMRKKDGLQEHSVNMELTTIRNIFRFAVANGYAVRNPAEAVPNLKEPRRCERWIPEKEEYERFSAELAKTRYGWAWRVWLLARAYAGVRPTECFFLEWPNIDFKADLIYIREKPGCKLKTGPRDIDMHPKLRDALLQWKQVWDEVMERSRHRFEHRGVPRHNWVFFNPANPTQRAKGLKKAIDTARKRAGLPRLTSYTLRHLFVSEAVMAGIDYRTIMSWTGHHSSRMIDEVYAHVRRRHAQSKMAMLGTAEGTALDGETEAPPPPWRKQKMEEASPVAVGSCEGSDGDDGAGCRT
ncbi:MAG TPA: tyrosine-type recombinase/integrase [Kiritimatiellia bacterium]|nr:tyrosine-type recombinase/integrase [Kiritimatiellia bacterium]